MKTVNPTLAIMVLLGVICLYAGAADAIIVDLDHIDVGTVVAGELPDGSTRARDHFEDFSLAVENIGSGPNSLVVCESRYYAPFGSAPVGEDSGDHIMLIARDVIDQRPLDGLVDDPGHQIEGGYVTVDFHAPVNMAYVLLDAVMAEGATFRLFIDGVVAFSVSEGEQWEEDGIFIDLDGYTSISSLRFHLTGGVGISRIAYFPESVAVETATWGAVKAMYR